MAGEETILIVVGILGILAFLGLVGAYAARYKKVPPDAAMVVYGTSPMQSRAMPATAQMATEGVRDVALTRRTNLEAGKPPSRANANAMREAEVSAARPQRYWATAIPAERTRASGPGKTSFITQ